jgi:hypothetical protein
MKVQENIGYARACLRDSLLRGEAPIASHLLYTQSGVLDDDVEAERKLGIEAGLAWGKHADASVFYLDRGFSEGMGWGLAHANAAGRPFEFRSLFSVNVKLTTQYLSLNEYMGLRPPSDRWGPQAEPPHHAWYSDLAQLAVVVKTAFDAGHAVKFEIGGVKP